MKNAFKLLFLTLGMSGSYAGFAASYDDLVLIKADKPFYIEIFETSGDQANGLVKGTKKMNNGKPARLNFKSAVDVCTKKNMRLPTKAEWLAAATNLGRNKKYTLRGDVIYKDPKDTANPLVNVRGHDSKAPTLFSELGIDACGTVGMTGNRAEWVYGDSDAPALCGGEYESQKDEDLELAHICDMTVDSSHTGTSRCVVDATDDVHINYTEAVKGELRDYLDKLKNGIEDDGSSEGNTQDGQASTPIDDMLIHNDKKTQGP